jgi:hypothetical protein
MAQGYWQGYWEMAFGVGIQGEKKVTPPETADFAAFPGPPGS